MSYKIEKTKDENVVNLAFKIDYTDFLKTVKEVYNEQKQYVQLPGFRKGKVPFEIAAKTYGEEIFYEDAINRMFPEMYSDAIKDAKLRVIAPPKVELKKATKGEDVLIDCKVFETPTLNIPKEKELKIDLIEKEVVDKEKIDKEIKEEAEKNVRIVPIKTDRKLKKGDLAIIDFTGYLDIGDGEKGDRIAGGSAENYTLEIGSDSFIPGFEENLVGMEKGNELDVFLNFPKEYHEPSLAGKPVVFTVKLHEIKEKEYPKIDDDFAKDQGYKDLKEYKDTIKKKLEDVVEKAYYTQVSMAVNEELVNLYDVNIVDEALENAAQVEIQQIDNMFSQQGLSIAQYLQMTNTTYEDFLKRMKDEKAVEIKTEIIYKALYKTQKDKIEKYIKDLSKEDKEAFEEFLVTMGITEDLEKMAKEDELAKLDLEYKLEVAKAKYFNTKNVKFNEGKKKETQKKEENKKETKKKDDKERTK